MVSISTSLTRRCHASCTTPRAACRAQWLVRNPTWRPNRTARPAALLSDLALPSASRARLVRSERASLGGSCDTKRRKGHEALAAWRPVRFPRFEGGSALLAHARPPVAGPPARRGHRGGDPHPGQRPHPARHARRPSHSRQPGYQHPRQRARGARARPGSGRRGSGALVRDTPRGGTAASMSGCRRGAGGSSDGRRFGRRALRQRRWGSGPSRTANSVRWGPPGRRPAAPTQGGLGGRRTVTRPRRTFGRAGGWGARA